MCALEAITVTPPGAPQADKQTEGTLSVGWPEAWQEGS